MSAAERAWSLMPALLLFGFLGVACSPGAPASGGTGQQRPIQRAQFTAVRGKPVPALTPSAAWQNVTLSAAGIDLRVPPGWTVRPGADARRVELYPPGASAQSSMALIAIAFDHERPFDQDALTGAQPYRIAGLDGRRQEPRAPGLPTHGVTIQAPYRGGTLTVTATSGPYVDLSPQLEGVLQTLRLTP